MACEFAIQSMLAWEECNEFASNRRLLLHVVELLDKLPTGDDPCLPVRSGHDLDIFSGSPIILSCSLLGSCPSEDACDHTFIFDRAFAVQDGINHHDSASLTIHASVALYNMALSLHRLGLRNQRTGKHFSRALQLYFKCVQALEQLEFACGSSVALFYVAALANIASLHALMQTRDKVGVAIYDLRNAYMWARLVDSEPERSDLGSLICVLEHFFAIHAPAA